MPTAAHLTKAFQWDLGRQVERLDFLLRWLPRYAEWGYEELYLHLEDSVEFPSLPGVARRDAYSCGQFARLVDAATAAGIRVVPIVNLLGHTQYLIKTPALRDLNELRDASGGPLDSGQICPLHPRTLAVAARLLDDLAPFCTAGKVHVGLDESFQLGRCPRCRAEIRRRGLAAHFAGHVRRLHRLAAERGLRLGLWADMLALLPGAIPALPRDVIAYDWYYYPFRRHPRVELRNFAEVDLAAPLRARGIEYWGCPMNGSFRHEPMPVFGDRLANIVAWWRRCRRVGAGGMLVTSWEANRLAIELTTVVDAAAACLWLNPGVEDPQEMLARGFARVFGRSGARRSARVALACDVHAFVGYPRWQINERWDVVTNNLSIRPYADELAFFDRRSRLAHALPPPLALSIAFRRYLAKRDLFVRRAAQAVWRLRQVLSAGRGGRTVPRAAVGLLRDTVREADEFIGALWAGKLAARAIWVRTRRLGARGPNEIMLRRDEARLKTWRRWLVRAERDPAIAWQATPVCGAWQLQFTVHHFAPAMQQIIVEQRQADGSWRTLHRCHLIEFRAFAAQPRTRIRREFSVPVPASTIATAEPGSALRRRSRLRQGYSGHAGRATPGTIQLRLAVHGLGQVGISGIVFTNGVAALHAHDWPPNGRTVLGQPASRRGFPRISGARPSAIRLSFKP